MLAGNLKDLLTFEAQGQGRALSVPKGTRGNEREAPMEDKLTLYFPPTRPSGLLISGSLARLADYELVYPGEWNVNVHELLTR